MNSPRQAGRRDGGVSVMQLAMAGDLGVQGMLVVMISECEEIRTRLNQAEHFGEKVGPEMERLEIVEEAVFGAADRCLRVQDQQHAEGL